MPFTQHCLTETYHSGPLNVIFKSQKPVYTSESPETICANTAALTYQCLSSATNINILECTDPVQYNIIMHSGLNDGSKKTKFSYLLQHLVQVQEKHSI